MQPSNPIQLAQASLLNAGIINVVIIDRGAMIQAVQGALVADWDVGQPVTDQLYVLAGMEALIMAMADQGTAIDPIELPAVFLGGNHEDGDLGVSASDLERWPWAQRRASLMLERPNQTLRVTVQPKSRQVSRTVEEVVCLRVCLVIHQQPQKRRV